MNKILLINRINVNQFKEKRKRIFFIIGNMDNPHVENQLIDTLNDIKFLVKEDIVYKYNGVQLLMKEEYIPKINKILTNSGFDIYSIYELYDPME